MWRILVPVLPRAANMRPTSPFKQPIKQLKLVVQVSSLKTLLPHHNKVSNRLHAPWTTRHSGGRKQHNAVETTCRRSDMRMSDLSRWRLAAPVVRISDLTCLRSLRSPPLPPSTHATQISNRSDLVIRDRHAHLSTFISRKTARHPSSVRPISNPVHRAMLVGSVQAIPSGYVTRLSSALMTYLKWHSLTLGRKTLTRTSYDPAAMHALHPSLRW